MITRIYCIISVKHSNHVPIFWPFFSRFPTCLHRWFRCQAMPTVVASQNGGTTGNLSEHVAGPLGVRGEKSVVCGVWTPTKWAPQKKALKKWCNSPICNRPRIVGYRNTPKKMVSLWEPFCIVLLDPTLVGKTFGKTCSLENHGTIGWHIFEGFKGVTFDHLWSVFGPRAPS